ncbi:Nuclear nucleic acid-binding protein C1D [Frankliniella fusca]|uniref:Nuclear nucleic acid-binding protein C1D n=1 Tax=Frankliniella fusca TaxID=407009 RepID=A0AAE1HU96_9NEOP|nr:Nuclear nucleic acid-binding protein C1D [Frankliniella fusca]
MAFPDDQLGELATDGSFKSIISKFHSSVDKIGETLELCCGRDVYADLSLEEKVEYDLFLSYSLNSLFWSYLRTQGVDPLNHSVKNELDRVRSYMTRAKQVHEKQSMPRVDKEAAERFVTSGLWEPGQAKLKPASRANKRKRSKSNSEDET